MMFPSVQGVRFGLAFGINKRLRLSSMALVEDWAEISEAWDVEGFAPTPGDDGLGLESAATWRSKRIKSPI